MDARHEYLLLSALFSLLIFLFLCGYWVISDGGRDFVKLSLFEYSL